MKDNIDEFIKMVHNNQFVKAHEVLEEDWKKLKKEEQKEKAKFLQALINGATSIALFLMNRIDASNRVWETFQKNKHLITTINEDEKEKYLFAIRLLEYKFITYRTKENI